MGKAPQETLGDGAAVRPCCERRVQGRRQRFLATRHLAAERTWLGKSEWGVRGLAAAHETRLLGDIAKVLPVAIATRRSDCEDALVDALRLTRVSAFSGGNHFGPGNSHIG
jgi:hypothetical protein